MAERDITRVPAADHNLPKIDLPEGGEWPHCAKNGTIVRVIRGTHENGVVRRIRIGFMWDGELVRDDGPG